MSNYQQAFESVVAKYKLSLFKIAATFEADPTLQMDLFQDMLLAIWQALGKFKQQSSLHTFIYKVAYNQAVSHVAKQSRKQDITQLHDHIACQRSDIESYTNTLQSLAHITSKISSLPIIQRQLVVMSLEGMSYTDMAEITGLSVSHVGVQLNRAKTKLKQLLEDK